MRIYLASPLGFSEATRGWYETDLAQPIRRAGHIVLDPWALTDPVSVAAVAAMPAGEERLMAWRRLNLEIGDRNRAAIDDCDMILAVLDGVDVDSGTAAEVGYGFGIGRLIFGYRGDFRKTGDNEGSLVNLQVENFIFRSGGRIIRAVSELDLILFEAERLLSELRGIARAKPLVAD